MTNQIPQKQNEPRHLTQLAAQRQLYSDAKRMQIASVVVSIPVVILGSILVAILPPLSVYTALWGVIATFLELLVFSQLQKKIQEKAAKIQQMFDCEVLQFQWDSLNCGIHVEPEAIIDASDRYKRLNGSFSSLVDWYPTGIGGLPIEQARIVCQRSNVWWDSQLRRRYSKWIVIILAGLTTIVLLIGLIGGLTLEKFILAVVTPLIPAFVFGLRQYIEHNEAAVKLDRLRESAEMLVREVVSRRYNVQDLERESYSLQTEIFNHRCRSPLILDWLYARLKKQDEQQMNQGAESLVEKLMKSP